MTPPTVTDAMIEAAMDAFGDTPLVGAAFTRRAVTNAVAAALAMHLARTEDKVSEADVAEAIAVLTDWLERQPKYTGDDPRAVHYRRNCRALTTAITAMQKGE